MLYGWGRVTSLEIQTAVYDLRTALMRLGAYKAAGHGDPRSQIGRVAASSCMEALLPPRPKVEICKFHPVWCRSFRLFSRSPRHCDGLPTGGSQVTRL